MLPLETELLRKKCSIEKNNLPKGYLKFSIKKKLTIKIQIQKEFEENYCYLSE